MADDAWFPRRAERLRVTLNARCSAATDAGLAGENPSDRGVTLVNITPEGCCMTTSDHKLTSGMAVLVRLETGESLTGFVRWCDGEKAGIEFEHYLSPARVEYLRREHSTFLSESDWSERRIQRSVC